MRWVTGWAINATDERAIALLPKNVWTPALRQEGRVHEIKGPDGEWLSYQVAELTGVRDLTGWPEGMRLIVRRVKPSRRDAKKLTAFEKRTGWRYQIIATNIPDHHGLSRVPGSGQVWFVDALYRDHAEVEDRVKAIKRIGLGLLPSKSWQLNAAWLLATTIDLDAWTRLLLLHDEAGTRRRGAGDHPDEAVSPARPAHRSRPQTHPAPRPHLAMGGGVHHSLAAGHPDSDPHMTAGHHPDDAGEESTAPPSAPWKPTPPQRMR
ncbi:hypothetical protein ABZZ74_44815 [Streptomyces sp. NPDC006476]|uniref:hypothetical protein n=1 Tax=Streptomyces sp. NPDC006476 TaxID=3157175 RepID=UPI0033B49689